MADDIQLELQRKIEALERKNKLLEEGLHQAQRLRQMFDRSAQELKATKLLLIKQGEVLEEKVQERRRAEHALSESKNQLEAVFNAVQDGILAADIQTKRFRMGNTAICRMLGYSLDELLNLRIDDLHREEDIANVGRQFERQLKGESSLSTLPMKRKDGTVFYADITAAPMTIDGQSFFIGVFRDITERKQAETKLAEQFNELQRWNEAMQGREMRILDLKHEVNELLGQTGQPPRYPSAESDAQKEE